MPVRRRPAPQLNTKNASVPDGLSIYDVFGNKAAIEAKYVEDWNDSIYNPLDGFKEIRSEEVIQQALKYDARFSVGGVRWITNSPEFAKFYTEKFLERGVKKFSFTIVPATLGGR